MRNNYLYLQDIMEAIEAIEQFVRGMEFEELKRDDKTSSAVVRKLEIIGEAAKNVSETIKHKYPGIPWKEMARMRDKLIHFYFGIKYELLWETIKKDIPAIKPLIQQALKNTHK
ncbi:MAG: DUF86 domain-containing protein [Planctomycetes bacterium]|nr:DUF86 domain-containing protein [Planctomycetota bacterium]